MGSLIWRTSRRNSWADISAPSAAFSWLPFTVQQSGRTFRPDPSWTIDSLAPTGKTYYVSRTGDGSNGLTWATAFTGIDTALGQADVDEIQIAAGEYGWTTGGWRGTNPGRSIAIYGAGSGSTIITTRNVLTWALDTVGGNPNTYKATLAAAVGDSVYDARTSPDFTRLVKQANAAAVESNPGSFYSDASSIWVRLSDSAVVNDTSVYVFRLASNGTFVRDSLTIYCEGLSFWGGQNGAFYPRNASATGGSSFVAKDCDFKYSDLIGLDADGVDCVLQSCEVGSNRTDGFNYHQRNTVDCNVIEIDCTGHDNGILSGSTYNGSSLHEAGSVVRLNGEHYSNAGQNVVDIDTSTSWNCGVYAHDSVSSAANTSKCDFSTNSTMWCDSCKSGDSLYDLIAGAGATLYYRDHIGDGNNNGAGTVTAY